MPLPVSAVRPRCRPGARLLWRAGLGLLVLVLIAGAIFEAFNHLLDEAGEYIQWAFRRAVGGTSDTAPSYRGLRTFAEPLATACQYAALVLARTNDLDHMHRAYVSGVLARLRIGQTNEAIAWAQEIRDRQSRNWFTRLDRPRAWSIPFMTGSPAGLLERMHWQEVRTESCRLTLALKLHKETHGAWPDSLSQLEPDILPKIPRNPFSGQPFHYRRTEGEYLFASVGPKNQSPDWLLSTNRLTAHDGSRWQVFSSVDPALKLAEWQRHQSPSTLTMDLRMLLRYGLLPRGMRIVAQPPTNALPPSTNSTNTAR